MARDYSPPGDALRAHMRSLLNNLERPEMGGDSGAWAPAVDIVETTEAVIIIADLAGVSRQDLKIMVDDQVVRLYGRREPTLRVAGARYHRMEIETGEFVRSFRMTVPIVSTRVEASLSDGLLRIVLPKLTRTASVEVQAV
ncbi:MAG: Hsp20/alpha crystallin family protein [Desulfarculaceae bacterium]|nr:Hsp20/alpha crystallin family protein [Desulfarculaceae bacterium]MCF8047119.1 Hsp20/alpha crystallin family protein [Desulfarculaceae bacterium]MCF8064931.1 Hsp20/alpha crystallin family protein [Desulfarculaceae bacterium]MCF8098122.1 Hsp20/alpha crystallin family protein [Desulfarculaceae bacterium]MCF8122970.1 Hsp20/alpha crystallin family protein [Desulfarculaceae bacterium]